MQSHSFELLLICIKLCYSIPVYKCLGHTYEIGNLLVHSYYLVMEKNLTFPKIGDIVASNVSGGFIETVVSVHKTNDTGYLETQFQRCNEHSHLNATRYSDNKIYFLKNIVAGYVMLRNMNSGKYYSTTWKKHKYAIYTG